MPNEVNSMTLSSMSGATNFGPSVSDESGHTPISIGSMRVCLISYRKSAPAFHERFSACALNLHHTDLGTLSSLPPSITRTWPAINSEESEAKKSAASAT